MFIKITDKKSFVNSKGLQMKIILRNLKNEKELSKALSKTTTFVSKTNLNILYGGADCFFE